jgi:hypothetical protein
VATISAARGFFPISPLNVFFPSSSEQREPFDHNSNAGPAHWSELGAPPGTKLSRSFDEGAAMSFRWRAIPKEFAE